MFQKNSSKNFGELNNASIKQLIRTIQFSENNFSLILAHCSYIGLREKLLEKIRTASPVQIREIHLTKSVKTLYTVIKNELQDESPKALMVLGLETLEKIDDVFSAANQVREEFRKFPFPMILWVTDSVLKKFFKKAPDFRTWAGNPVNFEPENDELIAGLNQSADSLFNEILNNKPSDVSAVSKIVDLSNTQEFESFLEDLKDRNIDLTPPPPKGGNEGGAALEFIQGRHEQDKGNWDLAIEFYEKSLLFYKQNNEREQQGVLQYYIAECYRQKGDLKKAESALKDCITDFENHHDLAAKCACKLCRVLLESQNWEHLETFAKEALEMNQTCGNKSECAECQIILAEAALHNQQFENAVNFAEQALTHSSEILDRDKSRLIIARAYQGLNQPEQAIKHLEAAIEQGRPELNPKLYIQIMDLLHELYFTQKHYLNAFHTKQEKYSLEQQFGFRAFIGAGRIKARRQIQTDQTDIAQEIQASGRMIDVDRLIEKISRTDCKLIVLHGESGVGKSSILEAGLIPALRHKIINTCDVMPVLIRNYKNWISSCCEGLNCKTEEPFSKEIILDELKKNEARNIIAVLIFDQFEEFFFANPALDNRQQFYIFLHDCLNTSFVKVILSLRQDYLHYLLECDRFAKLEIR